MNTIEIVFSIYGMIAIALVLVILIKIDKDNKRIKKRMLKEVKHGEWKEVTNGRGGHECSLCGNYALSYQSGAENLSDFCPYCGAVIGGVEIDN